MADTPADDATDKRAHARRLLMEAAITLFSEKSHVSVREIAQAAGVNHGLVHYYFGSKEQLRREALDHLIATTAAQIALDSASTIPEIVDVMTSLYTRIGPALRMGVRSILDETDPGVFANKDFPIMKRLANLVAPDDPSLGAKTVSVFLSSLVGSIVLRHWVIQATGMDESVFLAFVRRRHIALLEGARAENAASRGPNSPRT